MKKLDQGPLIYGGPTAEITHVAWCLVAGLIPRFISPWDAEEHFMGPRRKTLFPERFFGNQQSQYFLGDV